MYGDILERVRDALGYRAWSAPDASVARIAANEPPPRVAVATPILATRIAHWALRWRHTLPGRVLYRMTPSHLVDAMKARLR